MRRVLMAAAAAAPLCAALAAPALAETVIGNERTTAVTTATANNGQPDDVRISTSGSVKPANGTAVTLNSDDTVTNEGTIEIKNADDATGILVEGGRTGGVSNKGTIRIIEDYEPKDTDNDGDLDEPFAKAKNRYGIRLTGPGLFTGDIGNTGTVTVEGVDSFAISIESALKGNFTSRGSVTVRGDRSTAISVAGPVTGNVVVGGSVTALGKDAVGVAVDGDVEGAVRIDGSVQASGFRSPTRPADTSKLDADDLLIGGPAVRIAGDVSKGVLLDAKQPDKVANDDDEDDDGIKDAEETTALVLSYGSAPALQIGSASNSVTLGAVGTGADAYGLVVKGSVSANGVYDKVNATAIQIGVPGGGPVVVQNGARVTGEVSARAVKADATAIEVGAGASTAELRLEGVVTASTTSGEGGDARAIVLQQGASAPTLRNSGDIVAGINGSEGDSVAIEDRSGTLALLENSGVISALRQRGEAAVTGRQIAVDLSANTTGATLRQFGVNDGDDGADNKPDPDADSDGVDDADEPAMIGEVRFGSGADRLELQNGTLVGDVTFGAGADTLVLQGGATMAGALRDSDGQLAVDVSKGRLALTAPEAINVTSLNVGGESTLAFTLDPEADKATALNVAGTATFADGARIGVRFSSLLDGAERFDLVKAGTLSAGTLDESLLSETPYLFVADIGVDQAANSVFVDVRRRTAAEAGLNRAQTNAFDAVYGAIDSSDDLRGAFLRKTDKETFLSLYEQVLPEHAGGGVYALAAGTEAMSRAVAERVRGEAEAPPDGLWLQEVGVLAKREGENAEGFDAGGFGVIGGFESTGADGGAIGVSVGFQSVDVDDPNAVALESLNATMIEAGVYWRRAFGRLQADARGAIGYVWLDSDRRLVSAADGLNLATTAEWSGVTGLLHAGLAYEGSFGGRYYFRPEASIDYFFLREAAYEESGGGDGFDLGVDERESQLLTASVIAAVGARFGRDYWWAPEVQVGFRQIAGEPGDTVARFLSTGQRFTMQPDDAPGGAAVLGFSIGGGTPTSLVKLETRAELASDYELFSVLLYAKFMF